MATQVQFRRGTTSETAAFTGAVGEVTVDTNKETIVVHDGATAGGFPLLREDGSNSALASGSLSSPALKFANSTNTGLYSPSPGTVSFVANGNAALTSDTSGNLTTVGTFTASGRSTSPSFSLSGTSSIAAGFNGLYSATTNNVSLATNGVARLTVNASGDVTITGGLSLGSTFSSTSFGLTGAPSITPPAGLDGMYLYATNTIGFATNGTLAFRVDASGNVTFSGGLTVGSAFSAPSLAPTSATVPTGIGVYAAGTTGIGLATNSLARLTIDASGNVSIVSGTLTTSNTNTATIFVPTSATVPAGIGVYAAGTTGIGLATGGLARLTVDSSGNVSVVSGTLTTSNTNTATAFIPSSATVPAGVGLYAASTTGIGLATGGLARLTVDASGNVSVVSGTLTTSNSNTATTFIPTSSTAPAGVGVYAAGTTGIGLATGGSGRLTINSTGASTFTGSVTGTVFVPNNSTAPSGIGLYAAGTTGIGLATGSSGRLTIDASGNTTIVSGTLTTSSGSNTANSFIPTNATVPLNGLYLPAANTIALSTNTTERLRIDSAGKLTLGGASGAVVTGALYYRLNSSVAGANVTTPQSVFGVGVTLAASTVYKFEAVYVFSKSSGGTTHNFQTLFGGTATFNNALYTGNGTAADFAIPTTVTTGGKNINTPITDSLTTAIQVTSNIANGVVTVSIQLQGTFSTAAGGTFIPQYQLTAAPGGAYTTLAGSYINISQLGTAGSNSSAGTWA